MPFKNQKYDENIHSKVQIILAVVDQ